MSMSNYLVASLVASLLTSCSLLPSSLKRTIALIQYDLLGGNLNFATWIEIDWHSELGCQSASVSHCIVNKSWFEWGGTSVHLLLLICYTIQSSHLLRQKERKEKKTATTLQLQIAWFHMFEESWYICSLRFNSTDIRSVAFRWHSLWTVTVFADMQNGDEWCNWPVRATERS